MRSIQDGLYNYLSQHNTKRFKILVVFLFFSVLGFITLFSDKVFSDQNLYYYTFSTVVQGFLALVAFLGAVVIYKLQIIESELNETTNLMKPHLEYFLASVARTFSWIEAMNASKKIIDDVDNHKAHNRDTLERLRILYEKSQKLSEEKGQIRTKMVNFSLFSFLNVGFSLISMPITRLLVEKKLFYYGETFIVIGILASCLSLFLAFKIIRAVLGYSFSARFFG